MSATTTAPRRTAWHRVRHLARRAWRAELGIWRSLGRFALRRPRVPEGSTAFPYHRLVQPILIAFIVVSAIEVVVVDLLVHRWPPVRIPLLAVGIWGLTWMTGLWLAYLTRPHAVGPAGISVRHGTEVDVTIPWDSVHSVAVRKDVVEGRAPRVTDDIDGGGRTLHLRMQHETNIELRLDVAIPVELGAGTVEVETVRLYTDEPRAFLEAARPFM
ncbi:conserved hypothetical protein [Beutenbergia cavernae DSM 12333]|uniref:Uncharacterized protein n=1 Tax=Beutenbergia cavernae (strain ATCC BAA-8 / DSM 12333 / CCUG 43141 / JCM 11478 / NBRC 16432 / NCIMB 13614 / HKI 0122) TaxID=471853 RepID=C5BYL5_BEUC1|nr:hypothetical protein [Beutenbergia cavernae]ACQ78973.1 conserved hypothetical protein [Beutenbergia cavernae DSM 12333]